MTNEKKAKRIALDAQLGKNNGFLETYLISYKSAIKMAEWKDEQINLLLDAIDYAYLQTDGTYGDLALVVADKVEYLKSLRHGKIE